MYFSHLKQFDDNDYLPINAHSPDIFWTKLNGTFKDSAKHLIRNQDYDATHNDFLVHSIELSLLSEYRHDETTVIAWNFAANHVSQRLFVHLTEDVSHIRQVVLQVENSSSKSKSTGIDKACENTYFRMSHDSGNENIITSAQALHRLVKNLGGGTVAVLSSPHYQKEIKHDS